jgi:hypothetical protein
VSKHNRSRSRVPRRELPAPNVPGPRVARDAVAGDPERLLIDQIASGALDEHLGQIAQAVNARLGLVDTIKSLHALSALAPGDHVRFNDRVRPRYLTGIHGTILSIDAETATVRLDQAAGRFPHGSIHRCGPLILQRIERLTA